jgi:hypothetical protein
MRSWFIKAAVLAVVGLAGEARACPVCNTETGAQVRLKIFGEDFARTLAATLAPVPVLVVVVAGVSRWLGKEK